LGSGSGYGAGKYKNPESPGAFRILWLGNGLDAASLPGYKLWKIKRGPERIGSRPCLVCLGNSLDATVHWKNFFAI